MSSWKDWVSNDPRVPAGAPRRIFGAHAAHLRCCSLRSSLTQWAMRALRCSAAPSSWTTWSPNLSPGPPAVTLGETLAARRGERGLTIEQAAAATRIRAHYLSALESDELERLAAPVYAKGHLRTYARYLGLDPEPLVKMLHTQPQDPRRLLSIGKLAMRPRAVLTAPAVAAAALVLLAGAFSGYAWRQVHADQRTVV